MLLIQAMSSDSVASFCYWTSSLKNLHSFCLTHASPQSLRGPATGLIAIALVLVVLRIAFRLLKRRHPPVDNHGSFSELLNLAHGGHWTSLVVIADDARRLVGGSLLARTAQATGGQNEALAYYAGIISNNAQIYGIRPPSRRSEPIRLRWPSKIVFKVSGTQMDSTDPSGKELYRHIHLRTADVGVVLERIKKTADEADLPSPWTPLITVRLWAARAGWNIAPTIVGENECYRFTQRLRQSAVHKLLAFEGRLYRGTDRPAQSAGSHQFVPIPPEHFRDFEIEPLRFHRAEKNYQNITTKMSRDWRRLKGQIYYDLHVDTVQIKKWLEGDGKFEATEN